MNVWKKQVTHYTKNGKRVPSGTPEAEKRTTKTKRFYGTLRTADGKRKQVPLTEERDTSQTLLNRLQTDEDRYKAYGVDQAQREREKPLGVHLDAYEEHLRNKGNTETYVVTQLTRIRELVRSTKAKTIDELDAGRISRTLANWRDRGRPENRKGRSRKPLSVSSSNHYMRAIKGFSRWLWIEKRTTEDVLRNLRLMNAKAHKTRERRALTTQELTTLVETTETCGKRLCGFRDRDRAMLYVLAAYTGLRASELASLTVSSFDIDIDNATVTVEAGYSKRRRKDVLPLHPSLIRRLVPWLETKTKALWSSAWAERRHGAKMIKRDLKRAGIDYEDEHGRVVDFHALRHTFISSLAKAGVHPLKAKELARHSTITLTLDTYSHVETDELRDALTSLPDVP